MNQVGRLSMWRSRFAFLMPMGICDFEHRWSLPVHQFSPTGFVRGLLRISGSGDENDGAFVGALISAGLRKVVGERSRSV